MPWSALPNGLISTGVNLYTSSSRISRYCGYKRHKIQQHRAGRFALLWRCAGVPHHRAMIGDGEWHESRRREKDSFCLMCSTKTDPSGPTAEFQAKSSAGSTEML